MSDEIDAIAIEGEAGCNGAFLVGLVDVLEHEGALGGAVAKPWFSPMKVVRHHGEQSSLKRVYGPVTRSHRVTGVKKHALSSGSCAIAAPQLLSTKDGEIDFVVHDNQAIRAAVGRTAHNILDYHRAARRAVAGP